MYNLLKNRGINCQIKALGTNYKAIWYNRQYYCDSEGRPFVCWANEEQAAVNQNREPTKVVDGDGNIIQGEGGTVDQSSNTTNNIDLSNMTITLPDGTLQLVDSVIYDESTKTYNIDSHDTTNIYVTNNYYYTFHINYTSITYIGQTEEYNKYYEVYYELPDGRDSADLTPEDLEQLNLSIDVIPYGRSADDVSLRSLYHFDGDTKDSSYWNYCTDFKWDSGASLTYMDAGVFEGALFLDETAHDFTFTLPSGIGSQDFTLQFRYYQSHTEAPQTDSYINIGSAKVFQFNGGYFLDGSGAQLAKTPVGSWNELALIRDSGVLYYYLNGVSIGSVSLSSALSGSIQFHFGSDQQTFKYLDELRVLSVPLAKGGTSYTPTAVPYDTNLSLVLPDSAVPVADEYWHFNTEGNLLPYYDFSQTSDLSFVYSDFVGSDLTPSTAYKEKMLLLAQNSPIKLQSMNGFHSFVVPNASFTPNDKYYIDNLPLIPLGSYSPSYSSNVPFGALDPSRTYTFSVLDVDGVLTSLTFSPSVFSEYDYGAPFITSVGSNGLKLVFMYKYSRNSSFSSATRYLYLAIIPPSGSTFDFVYMELKEGDSPNTGHEFVESVTPMTPDQMKTPTLAVRTDIGITSYQIGGVRPSLPVKGQVWALVESGYIRSLQIYNGSAWEGCDGRIWTGERWIPYSSYNVITLQDMYDIVDATGNYEYIYTESGFWSWWQKAWNSFTEKLFSILGTGSGPGGSGGSSIAPGDVQQSMAEALSSFLSAVLELITTVLKKLLSLVTDLLSFLFSFLTDTVLGAVSDFFSAFADGSLFGFFQQAGEDGTTSTGLPSEVSIAFSFISGTIMALPPDLRMLLFFGLAAMLLISIFKFIRE